MFDALKTIALSAMIGLGGIAAVPAVAQADGLYLNLGAHNDARFGVYVGDRDSRYYRGDRYRDYRQGDYRQGDYRPGDRWDRQRERCSPERALDKAERMGLRRVAVRDISRHTITVSGRDRGDRVVVTFGRGANCPIMRY